MLEGDKIKVAQGENPCYLLLNQANRHGLIAGASGTGKTVTMKVLAEGFAQAGVPVFMADVKGDVTGMAQPGDDTEKVRERAAALGAAGWEPRGCDVRLWDMLGGDGVPVRITISDMGPDLLARLLGLTDVQRGVLAIAFRMADDNGMLLIECDTDRIEEGDELFVDVKNRVIRKINDPAFSMPFTLSEKEIKIVNEGGLLNYIENHNSLDI